MDISSHMFWQTLPRPIVGLSPMDGVTDAAFRAITARHGSPDLMMTEFTHVEGICRGIPAVLRHLDYGESERPIVAQVFGAEPEAFYKVAHIVAALGFDGLDINMGCPDKAVAAHGCGAGLIQTPDRAEAIIRAAQAGIRDWCDGRPLASVGLPDATVAAVMSRARGGETDRPRRPLPVSVKTRLGYDRVVVDSWIGRLLETRPAAISLHGRTLAQRYQGEADWDAIGRAAELVRGSDTLLIGNGDLLTPADVVRRVRDYGVDGVLVGRGALGNPWFFRASAAIRAACAGTAPPPDLSVPDAAERWRVAWEHAALFDHLRGPAPFTVMRKHLGWYAKGREDQPGIRARLVQARDLEEVRRLLAPLIDSETPVLDPVFSSASPACV
ncbi:MAG: tRNA-dihydrouridine synthase [Nitrospiria bacterium]